MTFSARPAPPRRGTGLTLPILTALVLATFLTATPAFAQDPVRVYAAGSLRLPFTAIGTRFTAQFAISVRFEFGASGLSQGPPGPR
jgi:ABC-type molybdate transport system substrate-binding protein